jgi:DNA-binding Lrp family transcriptional regulator
MTDTQPGSPDVSPLEVLGFSAEQESLYRMLLRNSGSTVEHLADLAGLPVGELREHVARLARAGLVEQRGATVVGRPPEEALAGMIGEEDRRVHSRAGQLEAVRALLPSLSADHLAATAPHGEPTTVEVVEGGNIAQLLQSLSASSAGEMRWLRPDPWNMDPTRQVDDWVIDLLRSGRRSSAIYDVQVFEKAPEIIRRRAEAGERVRLLTDVPTRLAVLGSSAALICERFDVFDDRRLVLRQHAMVASLILLFEHLWDKAMPVPGHDGEAYDEEGTRRLLLTQLAGGAKDEQIARAFGISVRTVRRRVAGLLDELGAASRFQAGVEAARRGWL